MSHFTHASVCLNGHVACWDTERNPEQTVKRCMRCGKQIISCCEECGAFINGYFFVEGYISSRDPTLAMYCHECGEPYPWTRQYMDALRDAINDDETADAKLKRNVLESIPSVIDETPLTPLAASYFKRFMGVCSHFTKDVAANFIAGMACEAFMKLFTGS